LGFFFSFFSFSFLSSLSAEARFTFNTAIVTRPPIIIIIIIRRPSGRPSIRPIHHQPIVHPIHLEVPTYMTHPFRW